VSKTPGPGNYNMPSFVDKYNKTNMFTQYNRHAIKSRIKRNKKRNRKRGRRRSQSQSQSNNAENYLNMKL